MTRAPPASAAAPSAGASLALACGPVAFALRSDDAAAAEWLAEFLAPWFVPTSRVADWTVTVSSAPGRRREIDARRPARRESRACFALEQRVVALPCWSDQDAIAVDDAERSCLFAVAPSRVEVLGEPTTRRWRFTLQWILHEIAATRLRRTTLDVHAAAVEHDGGAILVVGPKGAGKTTLSFALLRSGRCRWITNDRAFVEREGHGFAVRGMPTPVKILEPLSRAFPELGRGLRPVERPYLHTLAEALGGDGGDLPAELALSPAQVAHQLGVEAIDRASPAAIVFPELRADLAGFVVERLPRSEVTARLEANGYGRIHAQREPTVFEEIDGGPVRPPPALADEVAASIAGYRVSLGPGAHTAPAFASELLERIRG